jgi:putative membrane protein
MFNRSRILSLALVLAGGAWAQMQTQPQTQPGQSGPPSGVPQSNSTGNAGAVPQDQQVDPYMTDKDFIKNVSESSATEVEIGKLAADKASTDAVKGLGKQMVEAHTQTSQKMKQAAAALKVQVSDDPPRKAKKAEDKLAKLSGADFDRAYAKIAADEQKQTVRQFEREAKNGKAPALKDFASKNLSAEQERQKQADELASAATGSTTKQK